MDKAVYEDVWHTFSSGDHISVGSIWGGEASALIVPVEQPEILACIQDDQFTIVCQWVIFKQVVIRNH